MKFIEQIEPSVYLLKLYIKPNSNRQKINPIDDFDCEYLTINLRSKPIQNKANRELISLLKKKLRNRLISIELSHGIKRTTKIIKIVLESSVPKQEVFELLMK